MKIKVHSSEINRMMKTISQCIGGSSQINNNIEISYDDNKLTIRGTNGQYAAEMSTPVLGGDGERFCIDGTLFAKVCAMCSGEIDLSSDGKFCTVKGAGRTRLPIVNASIPPIIRVSEDSGKPFLGVIINAEDLSKGYGSVAYAVSQDVGRPQLTGVLMTNAHNGMHMVALDGFKMSAEYVPCDADEVRMIVPGTFLKILTSSTSDGEEVMLKTSGSRIEATTEGMLLVSGLLTGDFPDWERIMPHEFRTECLVRVDEFRNALKMCGVVNSKSNLVKLEIGSDNIAIMSNSEQADFEAKVPCLTNGDGLKIAFNHKFLTETMNAIGTEKAVMRFNSSVSPCVISGVNSDGERRLLLPVRVAGE